MRPRWIVQYSRALNNLRKCRADKTLHPQPPQPAAQQDAPPEQSTTPPGNETSSLRIEANSPPSHPSSNKVVGPAALAALRFQCRLNREYRNSSSAKNPPLFNGRTIAPDPSRARSVNDKRPDL